uniref:Centrosomal protein of 162 kDa n=1 Tax=Gasterosteus aculeatus aculeatus TaxID=481459 RepID=A0AAQ4NYZ1_GASAC
VHPGSAATQSSVLDYSRPSIFLQLLVTICNHGSLVLLCGTFVKDFTTETFQFGSITLELCFCVCADSMMGPAANTTAIGLDTIEEEEEKARFFAQLEAGASPNLDYSILNRELDSTFLCSGPSYVQSGASDMEALHEAYRQIHVVEPSDHQHPSMEGMGRAEHSVQPASTNDSGQTLRLTTLTPGRWGGAQNQHQIFLLKTGLFLRGCLKKPQMSVFAGATEEVMLVNPSGWVGSQTPIFLCYSQTIFCYSTLIDSPHLVMHVMCDLQREEDGSLVQELRGQLAHKERELQLMKEGAGEINTLRQQNYLLQIKLQSAEEASRKTRWRIEATDLAPEEKLQQIDKEIKEQETLIKGYQQENEKLYLQMKAQQAESKANEEAMCSETQRLLNELASTRWQLNKPSRTVGSVCLVDHTQRIADLLAQLNALQRNEAKLSEDFHRVKQEKQAQEVDLQLVKKERDLARAQAVSASGKTGSTTMRVLEEKHREEVVALRKKLQWFAENQELLDRDAGRLTAATSEIHQLQEQVERLKVDVDKRGSEQQRKTKEENESSSLHQVKELEQILRRRNPNSLPALMYAAAAAGCQEDVAAKTPPPPSRVTALLERRIQHLEAELEGHDEEAKRGLRAMEQQFNRIKLHYEQQIAELEQKQQLQALRPDQPRTSQAGPVEENHQQRERCLQDQIESLQQHHHLPSQAQSSPGRHQRQAEAASGARIQRLNRDLASKTRTIQDLCRTVERLQKERRNVTSAPNPQAESGPTETKRLVRSAKPLRCSGVGGEETFPAARCEKTYQPTAFTGSHISEVVQENETLKRRVEQLQLQSEQEKKALRADCERAEEELLAGHSAEQLSSMRAEHLRVLDQLRASHALEHSSSKVAELTNKLSAQEITVKHLQDRLKEMQGVKEALVISRTREDALQKQLTGLLKELKEAKEAQSPEVKLLCGLERKIVNMELRHQHREKELQQVTIAPTCVVVGSWQTSEAESWKRLAQDKSRELEAFRLELDSILDILRHLQRLGVVLPHS